MLQHLVLLIGFGFVFASQAYARDLVLVIAPKRANAMDVGRTRRIHREVRALHADADVITIDPVLSYDPAEVEFDGAIMREHLAWQLTLRPDPVRTVVIETSAQISNGELFVLPFGLVSREGGDRHFMKALGPLVGRLRENANIVLLSPGALSGRLSEATTLARRLVTTLGVPSGAVFGVGSDVHWPVVKFPGLRRSVRRRSLGNGLNSGRYFEFRDGVARSRYLRLGIDDEVIFGCAMALEPSL